MGDGFADHALADRAAALLGRHDPGDDGWRCRSVALAESTAPGSIRASHGGVGWLVGLRAGWLDRARGQRAGRRVMAFIEEDSSEDEGELLGLGLMDEGEDDEGGAWSDFDALNSTRFAYEIVEGAWFGLLALPGEGMDAWPVTYSDVSEGRTVVAAVDFAHLMHAWFVEGNGVAPALADAPRGVAKAVIGAAADAFGFDRRAAIRAWKRGYLSEAKVAEHKRLKKLSEDEALAAILEGAEAERRASGAASAERSPAWREDLETLLVHPAG